MEDYSNLKDGDIGPVSTNPIKIVILKDVSYVIFIDSKDDIIWATNSRYGDWAENSGDVLNQVSVLENLSEKLLNKREVYNYKCMIAEGVARLIDERDVNAAKNILTNVEAKLTSIGKENYRIHYLLASMISTITAIALLITVWVIRSEIIKSLNETVLHGLICSLGGAIGAFVTTFFRAKNYNANIDISKKIHALDGVLRIFYGLIAGIIVYVGIKSNLIFGFVNDIEKNSRLLFFLCSIAGASEVLLPNIIKQTENKAENDK